MRLPIKRNWFLFPGQAKSIVGLFLEEIINNSPENGNVALFHARASESTLSRRLL